MTAPDKIVGPLNFGIPSEITIRELALKVLELTGSDSQLIEKPLPEDDPTQRCPNIDLVKKTLGWEPHISLEIGLNKTIDYFRKII